jgi:hypothetical protein
MKLCLKFLAWLGADSENGRGPRTVDVGSKEEKLGQIGELWTGSQRRLTIRPCLFSTTVVAGLIGALGWGATPAPEPVLKQIAAMPLGFEPNRGQMPGTIDYISTGIAANIALQRGSATLTLAASNRKTAELRLAFVGGSSASKASAEELLPGFTQSYWTGSDSAKWIRDVPEYAKVRYRDVWPGVDVVFYGDGHQLEYDFVVAPGADPAVIRMKFSGMDSMTLDPSGDLRISTAAGSIRQKAPKIYQEISGVRQNVRGEFVLGRDGAVAFDLAAYDSSRPLVIDPLLVYYTRLGGAAPAAASGFGIAVTNAGVAYLVGQTSAAVPNQTQCPGKMTPITSAYLFKLDATGHGSNLILSGCDGDSAATAVALDGNQNVFITGWSKASNFIFINNGFQTTLGDPAGSGHSDGFMVELAAAAGVPNTPLYSTYIGGAGDDFGNAIAIDSNGKAYVAGKTCASNFHTTTGPTYRATGCTGLTVKIDTAAMMPAQSLAYSTLIGGMGADAANGVRVDANGDAFVAGSTTSTAAMNDFLPFTSTGFFTSKSNSNQDGFLVKLNATGSAATWLTFMTGAPANALSLDANGNAYVTGQTTGIIQTDSTNSGFQTATQGGTDAFLQRYNTNVNGVGAFVYSTYLGGSGNDVGYGVSSDSTGNAQVVGSTSSTNFPSTSTALFPNPSTPPDAFVTEIRTNVSGLASEGSSLVLGGDGGDDARSVADVGGVLYLTGTTASSNFGGQTGQVGSAPYGIALMVALAPVSMIGVFHPGAQAGTWYLDNNGNGRWDGAGIDLTYPLFGLSTDIPVTGDWDGSGHTKIGVYHKGTWYLDTNGDGMFDAGDTVYQFGLPGDIPVTGDWDGSGRTKIGVYHNGTWYLDTNGNGQYDGPAIDTTYPVFGLPTDIPVTGDWDGSGKTKIGVYHNGTWYLDLNGNGQWDGAGVDTLYPVFGLPSDIPVTGDWNGAGKTKIGVYHDGTWYLDANGNGAFDANADITYPVFGLRADVPVIRQKP